VTPCHVLCHLHQTGANTLTPAIWTDLKVGDHNDAGVGVAELAKLGGLPANDHTAHRLVARLTMHPGNQQSLRSGQLTGEVPVMDVSR
jgi:hypothetical protein